MDGRRSNIPAWDCHAGEETALFSDCSITEGLTHLRERDLGVLIRPSTDFNQQVSDEMAEALIIAQVTLHTMRAGSSF